LNSVFLSEHGFDVPMTVKHLLDFQTTSSIDLENQVTITRPDAQSWSQVVTGTSHVRECRQGFDLSEDFGNVSIRDSNGLRFVKQPQISKVIFGTLRQFVGKHQVLLLRARA
jgi:hypothetical protein